MLQYQISRPFRTLEEETKAPSITMTVHHRKALLSSFHLNAAPQNFIHRLKSYNHLGQHSKQQHRRVLLSSFSLSGHTSGFHPQTQKLEPPCTA